KRKEENRDEENRIDAGGDRTRWARFLVPGDRGDRTATPRLSRTSAAGAGSGARTTGPATTHVVLRHECRKRRWREPWRSRRRGCSLPDAGVGGRTRQRNVARVSEHPGLKCRERARPHREWNVVLRQRTE